MENSYFDLQLGIQGWEITVGNVKILGGFDPHGKPVEQASSPGSCKVLPWGPPVGCRSLDPKAAVHRGLSVLTSGPDISNLPLYFHLLIWKGSPTHTPRHSPLRGPPQTPSQKRVANLTSQRL